MKNKEILLGLILIIVLCVCFKSEAASHPVLGELYSFTFYYNDGTKINFDEVRDRLINCIYPPKERGRSEYETRQEYEENKNKCACPESNCENIATLKDVYFMIPVESMRYDADKFKFTIVADAKYKMFASKSRVEPANIIEARKKYYNIRLNKEIKPFMAVNALDRIDYVNRFADSPNLYQRTYIDSFTREYFTNAILDTRHDGIGSGNEVIYSIRIEADSPIEKARRLKTMGNNLVFMIHGDMIYEDSGSTSELTRVQNVFYVDKIILFNLEIGEALISATP
jgi:hypothetical protein